MNKRLYHRPADLFVADFIGSPEINFFESTFDGTDTVDTGAFDFDASPAGIEHNSTDRGDICITDDPL